MSEARGSVFGKRFGGNVWSSFQDLVPASSRPCESRHVHTMFAALSLSKAPWGPGDRSSSRSSSLPPVSGSRCSLPRSGTASAGGRARCGVAKSLNGVVGEREDNGAEDQARRAKDREPANDRKRPAVCRRSRFPTRIGYSRLSISATTMPPQAARIAALPHCPVATRKIAAGSHIMNAPSTGTIASSAIIAPQRIGAGRPSPRTSAPERALHRGDNECAKIVA